MGQASFAQHYVFKRFSHVVASLSSPHNIPSYGDPMIYISFLLLEHIHVVSSFEAITNECCYDDNLSADSQMYIFPWMYILKIKINWS